MKRASHSRKLSRAFTLLEMTLAMAAAAIILTAIYGLFSRAVHLRDNATGRIREARVRAHAAAVLRNDLRNARLSGGKLAATLEGSAGGKSGSYPGYLTFTATTTPELADDGQDLATTDLQRVEYYIVNDPDSSDQKAGLLVRTTEQDVLATVQESPAEEPVLAGVESMEVSFYDGSSWQSSWNYAETKTIPEGVRVRLQPAAKEGEPSVPPIEVLVPWTTKAAIETTTTDTSTGGTTP